MTWPSPVARRARCASGESSLTRAQHTAPSAGRGGGSFSLQQVGRRPADRPPDGAPSQPKIDRQSISRPGPNRGVVLRPACVFWEHAGSVRVVPSRPAPGGDRAPLGQWTSPPAFEAGDRPFESSTARQQTLRSSGGPEHQAAILGAVSSNLTGESRGPSFNGEDGRLQNGGCRFDSGRACQPLIRDSSNRQDTWL